MYKQRFLIIAVLMVTAVSLAFRSDKPEFDKIKKYKEFELTADISHLTADEKEMLSYLFKAADIMNDLYWQQAYGDSKSLLKSLKSDDEKKFAMINYGPWDRLAGNTPWVEGFNQKPKGANFYPADMTVEEFEKLDDNKKTDLYTLIRRNDKGELVVVPYHVAYEKELKEAAGYLLKASKLTTNEKLKNYLELRADALVTDNYQPSDFAWMDMKDSKIDLVIGAIENYEDALFGYKAAYEAFILVKDQEWSKRLAKFASFLPELQKLLPVPAEYKAETPGSDADLNVYDAVYYAGDCNAGSKTIAINLPNDEEVQLKKGSRKLQLKNSMQAKFDNILMPISKLVIHPDQLKHVKFNAFFTNTMFHEVAHGMGIKKTVENDSITVRHALKEAYSPIEENKADILGLWLVTKLHEKGQLDGDIMDYYVTFMAGIFRSTRFGASSSHGKANMMRFQYFMEHGAFVRDGEGFYIVDFARMKDVTEMLVAETLILQGDGKYQEAADWITAKGVVPDVLQDDLNKINDAGIPVDIVFSQGPHKLGL